MRPRPEFREGDDPHEYLRYLAGWADEKRALMIRPGNVLTVEFPITACRQRDDDNEPFVRLSRGEMFIILDDVAALGGIVRVLREDGSVVSVTATSVTNFATVIVQARYDHRHG